MLDTYKMITAVFLMIDKINQVRFFKKIFLIANVNPKIVFKYFFLS